MENKSDTFLKGTPVAFGKTYRPAIALEVTSSEVASSRSISSSQRVETESAITTTKKTIKTRPRIDKQRAQNNFSDDFIKRNWLVFRKQVKNFTTN